MSGFTESLKKIDKNVFKFQYIHVLTWGYNIYKIQTEREREKNENRIIRTNWSIKRSY